MLLASNHIEMNSLFLLREEGGKRDGKKAIRYNKF